MIKMPIIDSITQGLVLGIVAGVIVYTLQVIWDIRKDYLIIKDKLEELESKVSKLEEGRK